MYENPKQTTPSSRLQTAENGATADSDAQKLEASLAYRNRQAKGEEHGTAQRRPKQGLIYDAPLGLKF